MARPRLLDLFCGAGGCSVGYHRAGFDVVGVDLEDQPRYPFEFVRADALEFPLDGFDAIHALPPCQRYSKICRAMGIANERPDLVAPIRDRLMASGVPYVIENVAGAPLIDPVILCGSMFRLRTSSGLWLRRHRLFETSFRIDDRPICRHPKGVSIGVYGNGTNRYHLEKLGRTIKVAECREAMGIDWMTRKELSQAIPPAYTEWIGNRLIAEIAEMGRSVA